MNIILNQFQETAQTLQTDKTTQITQTTPTTKKNLRPGLVWLVELWQ